MNIIKILSKKKFFINEIIESNNLELSSLYFINGDEFSLKNEKFVFNFRIENNGAKLKSFSLISNCEFNIDFKYYDENLNLKKNYKVLELLDDVKVFNNYIKKQLGVKYKKYIDEKREDYIDNLKKEKEKKDIILKRDAIISKSSPSISDLYKESIFNQNKL